MRPHKWIDERSQAPVLWVVGAATLVVGLSLNSFRPPGGWLPLEFPAWCRSAPSPDSWSVRERETALFGLGLDFLFMVLYPFFLSLFFGRGKAQWALPDWMLKSCGVYSGLVLLACPLDAAENIGLHRMITQSADGLELFVTVVSAAKWFIALASFPLALACGVVAACRRIPKRSPPSRR